MVSAPPLKRGDLKILDRFIKGAVAPEFLTSKLEVDPPGDLKRRKVPVLESISGGTHLRVIQTN